MWPSCSRCRAFLPEGPGAPIPTPEAVAYDLPNPHAPSCSPQVPRSPRPELGPRAIGIASLETGTGLKRVHLLYALGTRC